LCQLVSKTFLLESIVFLEFFFSCCLRRARNTLRSYSPLGTVESWAPCVVQRFLRVEFRVELRLEIIIRDGSTAMFLPVAFALSGGAVSRARARFPCFTFGK